MEKSHQPRYRTDIYTVDLAASELGAVMPGSPMSVKPTYSRTAPSEVIRSFRGNEPQSARRKLSDITHDALEILNAAKEQRERKGNIR